MSHQLCLPDDADAVADGVATVVYVLEGCGNHVHVVVGIYTAGDAQAQQIEASEAVLACDGVSAGKDVADLATADTGLKIKLYGERLCRELFLWYV